MIAHEKSWRVFLYINHSLNKTCSLSQNRTTTEKQKRNARAHDPIVTLSQNGYGIYYGCAVGIFWSNWTCDRLVCVLSKQKYGVIVAEPNTWLMTEKTVPPSWLKVDVRYTSTCAFCEGAMSQITYLLMSNSKVRLSNFKICCPLKFFTTVCHVRHSQFDPLLHFLSLFKISTCYKFWHLAGRNWSTIRFRFG